MQPSSNIKYLNVPIWIHKNMYIMYIIHNINIYILYQIIYYTCLIYFACIYSYLHNSYIQIFHKTKQHVSKIHHFFLHRSHTKSATVQRAPRPQVFQKNVSETRRENLTWRSVAFGRWEPDSRTSEVLEVRCVWSRSRVWKNTVDIS